MKELYIGNPPNDLQEDYKYVQKGMDTFRGI